MGNCCTRTHPEDNDSPIAISPAREEEILAALKKILNVHIFTLHRGFGIYYRTIDNNKTCSWLDTWSTPDGVSKVVHEPLENFIDRIQKASPCPFVMKIQACHGYISDLTHNHKGAYPRIYRFMRTHMLSISFVHLAKE